MTYLNEMVYNNDQNCLSNLSQIEQSYHKNMVMYIDSLKYKLKKLEKWEYEKNLYKSRLENIKNKNIILHNQLTQTQSKMWITRLLDALFCRHNSIGIEVEVESDRWSDLSLKDNEEFKSRNLKDKKDKLDDYDIDTDRESKSSVDSSPANTRLSSLTKMIRSSIENFIEEEELY